MPYIQFTNHTTTAQHIIVKGSTTTIPSYDTVAQVRVPANNTIDLYFPSGFYEFQGSAGGFSSTGHTVADDWVCHLQTNTTALPTIRNYKIASTERQIPLTFDAPVIGTINIPVYAATPETVVFLLGFFFASGVILFRAALRWFKRTDGMGSEQ